MPLERTLGTSSIGSLSAPTVMAVRSSVYSTALPDDPAAQPAISGRSKTTQTQRMRMLLIIAGRELEPIIELRRLGILLTMSRRFGPISAQAVGLLAVLAICASARS